MGWRGVLAAMAVVLLVVEPAYAYIDPGSGSMMLQLLLGGLAGLGVAIRLYWRRIRSLLGRRSEAGKTPAGDGGERE